MTPTRKSRWPQLSTTTLTACVALWCLLAFNLPFWSKVLDVRPIGSLQDALFIGSVGLFAVLVINLFLTPFSIRPVAKPALVVILLLSSLTAYFMGTYGVLIDKVMIRNVFETDAGEVSELLTFKLFASVGLLGVLPSWIVIKLPLARPGWRRELLHKLVMLVVTFAGIGLVAAFFYQDQAALLRNHREVRSLLVPVNLLGSLATYGAERAKRDLPYQAIGADARKGPRWQAAATTRPTVTVIVVGETARAANFSLGGYARETNPDLAKIPGLVYFTDVASCGTSTAISLPCMFSDLGRKAFSAETAKARDNLLDVLATAGLEVTWFENNSGCKGICRKVKEQRPVHVADPELCRPDECHDEILLRELRGALDSATGDAVIVLHTHGSHGPGYHLRYPQRFERFKPVCREVEFQKCTVEEIVNAYDNTMLYADHVVAGAIGVLQEYSDRFDGALLFASDHGESLGENGLFLHGVPYALAPDYQTHVPMLFWSSPALAQRFGIDQDCLMQRRGEPLSHDNIFHSILGLLDIQTTALKPELDLFGACRR